MLWIDGGSGGDQKRFEGSKGSRPTLCDYDMARKARVAVLAFATLIN